MIRFVDLTQSYWTDPESGKPICAFLDTTTDRFLDGWLGDHTFDNLDDVRRHPMAERLERLMPEGFFDQALPSVE